MAEKEEKAKKAPAKEKTAPRKKKTPSEAAAHPAAPHAAGAEEQPKKKTARPHKKTAEAAAPAGAVSGAVPKEKAPRKTRVKAKKEAEAPAAPAAAQKAVERPHAAPAHAPAPAVAKPPVPHHKAAPSPAAPAKPAPAPVKAPAPAPQPPVQKAPPAVPPTAPAAAAAAEAMETKLKGEIVINELTTVRDLAEKMKVNPGDIIKKLLALGTLATINQRVDASTAEIVAHEFGYAIGVKPIYEEEKVTEEEEDVTKLKPRSPVVTIMGHVDHGKTSLLDAVRESRIAEGEAGGITQHIGAYKVKTARGDITFLDTPGHEAFTAMRSRGAQATDIVVLVVSAADGVMPQTVEAIDHARAAAVPIIVAINKIDLPTSNANQVKQELSKYNLVPEEWGGDTIMVEVSAKKRMNIDQMLEMILLKAEITELKANPERRAKGVVIEARLDSRRGPVATVLVQAGTLRIGDNVVVGTTWGKIRAMTDDHGQRHTEALPSTPVEILGLNSPPQAGDQFVVVEQEFQARQVAQARQSRVREESLRPRHHLSLEDISLGKVKELRMILKTDVQGSLGALMDSLNRLSTEEINLKIIHTGVGAITESDVTLGAASDALIIGFNLRPDTSVERLADQEGVSIRVYRIIYELISDVKAAMEGLLEPSIKETTNGKASVKQVFKITKAGTVAGVTVTEGKALRSNKVRLVRDNVIVYEGAVASLHRFKEDVREVEKGFECGIALENFSDIKPGDVMEFFVQEKVARKL